MLAEENVKTFRKHGVTKIVTTCPHGYNTLRNEYPFRKGEVDVQHYTQLLGDLIDRGQLTFSKRLDKVVTYHDPCYLGRYNNIYEPPRQILESIPGVQLVEMPRNREDSFCCGGGGGRMWIEENSVENVCNIRVRDANDTDAEILATACPFCLIELEDGVKSMGLEGKLKVIDTLQLVADAL
jgi:Fe-S oxidoreductase